MSKAIILPFFLLAGIASGSQQPQGVVGNNYDGEDDEGSSLQRRTALSGEDDVAPQQQDVYNNRRRLLMCRVDADCVSIVETCVNGMCLRTNLPRDDGGTYLEDEYAVHSTAIDTDFYDDYEINNTDEEVMDESRLQLRGSNNLRLNRNSAQCEVGNLFNNCPSGQTCWRRRLGGVGSSNWNGNAICVPDNACLPRDVFVIQDAFSAPRTRAQMERDCCSGKVWMHSGFSGVMWYGCLVV